MVAVANQANPIIIVKPGDFYLCSICKQQVYHAGSHYPYHPNKGLVCIECNKPPTLIRAFNFLWFLVLGFFKLLLGVLFAYIIWRALWGVFNAPLTDSNPYR
jgi:hypothetical protein